MFSVYAVYILALPRLSNIWELLLRFPGIDTFAEKYTTVPLFNTARKRIVVVLLSPQFIRRTHKRPTFQNVYKRVSQFYWALYAPDAAAKCFSHNFKLFSGGNSFERTSIIVCPRKSSDSLVSFWRNLDLRSLSSSHTLTFMRSDELWHSLKCT